MKKYKSTPWNASLNYLAKRNRSTKDVAAHLARYGFSNEEIADCIERLTAQGYLDDKKYAQDTLLKKYIRKNDSSAMIRQRLKNERIDESVIEEIMDQLDTDYEKTAFEKFLQKESQYKGTKEIDWQKLYRKALRLGFEQYLIYEHAQRQEASQFNTDNRGEHR